MTVTNETIMLKIPLSQNKQHLLLYKRTKDHLETDDESSNRDIMVQKNYYSFCDGKAVKHLYKCVWCRVIIYKQDFLDNKKNIGLGIIFNLMPFLYLLCKQII